MPLTTISKVKNYWRGNLPNADSDPLLNTLVEWVSDGISRYCDRTFTKQNFSEWYPAAQHISLRQYPITAIWYCGHDTTAAATLRYAGSCRWATCSANQTEITTAVMNSGSPVTKRYATASRSVSDLTATVLADSVANPDWVVDNYTDFSSQPAYMLFPFASWDARVGCRLSVPAVPLSVIVPPTHERTVETVTQEGSGAWVYFYYEAGYTLPDDGDENGDGATDGDLPAALVDLATRCVVESYGTSVDYEFSKNHIFDWIEKHAREFVPFRKLSL